MANKLVHGNEIQIKVKGDQLRTLTIPQLSHEFYGKAIRASEFKAKAWLGNFSAVASVYLTITHHFLFVFAVLFFLYFSMKNQFNHGYLQGEVDDRATKRWVRIDKA